MSRFSVACAFSRYVLAWRYYAVPLLTSFGLQVFHVTTYGVERIVGALAPDRFEHLRIKWPYSYDPDGSSPSGKPTLTVCAQCSFDP